MNGAVWVGPGQWMRTEAKRTSKAQAVDKGQNSPASPQHALFHLERPGCNNTCSYLRTRSELHKYICPSVTISMILAVFIV